MKHTILNGFGISLGLLLLVTGCGKKDDSISDAQLGAIGTAIRSGVSSGTSIQLNSALQGPIDYTPRTASTVTTKTFSCTGGGSGTVAGTFAGSAGAATFTFTLTFNACKATGDDGKTYTVTSTGITAAGNITLAVTGTSPNTTTTLTSSITENGNVTVVGDTTLSCDIAITGAINATIVTSGPTTTSTTTGTISGTVCGQSRSVTVNSSTTI